jgi:hypothetical protein
MLVIETPEASLDGIFMRQTSHLFRRFGRQQNGENVFLASTNLNQSEMISRLLGFKDVGATPIQTRRQRIEGSEGDVDQNDIGEIPVVPVNERSKHIINLLDIAAPNAALNNHRAYYEQRFSSAVYFDKDDNNE